MFLHLKRVKLSYLLLAFILFTASVIFPIIHIHAHDEISHRFNASEYCTIGHEGHDSSHHENHPHLISESRPISRQSNLFEHFIAPANATIADILFFTGKPLKTLQFQRSRVCSNNGFLAAFSGLSPPLN